MVNQSKAKDPRFWKKWEKSGAVGTIEDSVLNQYRNTMKGIESMSPQEIRSNVGELRSRGFKSEADKMISHPAYKENALSLNHLRWVANGSGHPDEFAMKAMTRGVDRGLYSQKEVDAAIRSYEDIFSNNHLRWVANGSGHPDEFAMKAMTRGVDRGLYSQKEVDAAIRSYEQRIKTSRLAS